ncbi:tetratricopeptide repeat protein [Candidatus Laterigemmans baculatus]|uniref:hypothetical protein n=1 Tax=Candidatus Laterigemmans baculatus TaxID=2770505 RepID=UPI0013DCC2EF|nr:hypothetical protein [Candidatus Laterigemmans baculatus]
MFRATALAAVVTLVTGASTAGAQDAVLAEVYGQGVHRYFAHDYDGAYLDFTRAIDNGLRDPRVYYFRGLAAAATGRLDEAAADWRIGGVFEARGNYSGSVGRALARIQGAQRMQLEAVRLQTRLEERARVVAEERARYEGLEAAEPRVLRGGVAPAPPAPAPAPAPAPPAPDDARTNPFDDDNGLAPGEPMLESENALGDPLNQPAPATEAPAEEPADDAMDDAAPATDPFGDLGTPAPGDDPFAM